MLKRLYNFLCLVNFELTLDETNVLLGTNGSGKTSDFLFYQSITWRCCVHCIGFRGLSHGAQGSRRCFRQTIFR